MTTRVLTDELRRVDHDAVWRALAHPARRRILDRLRHGPRRTGELTEGFEFSRPAAVQHLGRLVDAGLVLVREEGRVRWNHLNPVPLRAIYERWMEPFTELWATSLLELKRSVEAAERSASQENPDEPVE